MPISISSLLLDCSTAGGNSSINPPAHNGHVNSWKKWDKIQISQHYENYQSLCAIYFICHFFFRIFLYAIGSRDYIESQVQMTGYDGQSSHIFSIIFLWIRLTDETFSISTLHKWQKNLCGGCTTTLSAIFRHFYIV